MARIEQVSNEAVVEFGHILLNPLTSLQFVVQNFLLKTLIQSVRSAQCCFVEGILGDSSSFNIGSFFGSDARLLLFRAALVFRGAARNRGKD